MKNFFIKIVILIFLYTMPTYAGDKNSMIDDFTNNPQKRWQFFTDQVMGGISEGTASILSDNAGPYVRLEGSVSTANNGGFIQIRRDFRDGPKNAKGLLLRVKGNGENYYIHLRTGGTVLPWQYYQSSFPTSKKWNEIKLPFSKFERSSSWISKRISADKIKTIGIVAYGKDHKAILDVSHLSFY